jgi:adenosylcobinamide-GDP ribazoletransferase
MLKEIKNLLAFLTILPLKMDADCLIDSAKFMYIFPLIGVLIGLIAGVFALAISQVLPSLVVGALAFGLILLLTGLHHTDGLLDFGDAVMYHGTAERKIEIMHDQLTGAGALGLGIMTLLVTAISIGEIRSSLLIPSLIVIELSAKLSMVVGAWAGKPVHQGMNSLFLEKMHGKTGNLRLIAALLISYTVALPLMLTAGFVAVTAAIITGLIMVAISHHHFKGVTGDVLGATNELARMVALLALLSIIR